MTGVDPGIGHPVMVEIIPVQIDTGMSPNRVRVMACVT